MASIKLYSTLALIAALYCTALAVPLFPSASLPIKSTEATTMSTPGAITTSATLPIAEPTSGPADTSAAAGGMPGSLGEFLQVHKQDNKGEPSSSTPDSTLNSTTDDQPKSLQSFLKIHSPDSSVQLAFHMQLYTNITLRRYTEAVMQNFTQSSLARDVIMVVTGLRPGQFVMGMPSFDPVHGTFIAPVKGIYHFTAQVHLFKSHQNKITRNPYITASVCINGDCENNAALQSIAGITSERFSALVTGELQVEKDQTVSVFVKNSSDRRLVVDEATSFMGYFISESL